MLCDTIVADQAETFRIVTGGPADICQSLLSATALSHKAQLSLSSGRPDSASEMNVAWSGSHPSSVSGIWAQHQAPSFSLPSQAVNA